MATVTPATTIVNIRGMSVPRLTWADIVTGDTAEPYGITAQAAIAGSIQIGGTFGGTTVTLQGSKDGTTFFGLKDVAGNAITATAAAYFEFTTAALYIRPALTSGSANAVDITVLLRG